MESEKIIGTNNTDQQSNSNKQAVSSQNCSDDENKENIPPKLICFMCQKEVSDKYFLNQECGHGPVHEKCYKKMILYYGECLKCLQNNDTNSNCRPTVIQNISLKEALANNTVVKNNIVNAMKATVNPLLKVLAIPAEDVLIYPPPLLNIQSVLAHIPSLSQLSSVGLNADSIVNIGVTYDTLEEIRRPSLDELFEAGFTIHHLIQMKFSFLDIMKDNERFNIKDIIKHKITHIELEQIGLTPTLLSQWIKETGITNVELRQIGIQDNMYAENNNFKHVSYFNPLNTENLNKIGNNNHNNFNI